MKSLRLLFLLLLCSVALPGMAQTAKAHSLQMTHNYVDPNNGRKMLKVNFKMEAHGLAGHTLKPVLFIDVNKGSGHKFANGSPMKQEGCDFYVQWNDTYWNSGDAFLGIYNDSLNPLPGKHTYWGRILIWDTNTGRYLPPLDGTEWFSYDMTGSGGSASDGGGIYIPPVYNGGPTPCGVCHQTGRCATCAGRVSVPTMRPAS